MIELAGRLATRTLGWFEVRLDGRILPPPPGRGARLLRLLLSTRGHALPKECIAETLWPDSPTAIANLHAAARDVRRWMGIAEGLVYERELYALTVRDIDADRFETEISSARTLRRADPSQAGRRYQAALAIYEGPFLPEETGLDCVNSRRVQLEVWFAEAAMFVGTAALENGELDAALDLGTRVSDLDETREDAARLQMRALASLGRRAEALRRFERLRLILGRELGCHPDPATQAILEEVAGAVRGQPPLLRLEA